MNLEALKRIHRYLKGVLKLVEDAIRDLEKQTG